jgi:hypothetical protein
MIHQMLIRELNNSTNFVLQEITTSCRKSNT